MHRLGNWKEVVERDFPERHPITDATRQHIRENKRVAHRYRCSMRIACGRIHTDAEYESWREQVLSAELP